MTSPDPSPRPPTPSAPRRLGLPIAAIVGLALLTAPRVILHDLGMIQEGTGINALLVALPPVAWIVIAVVARVPNAFVTVLAIGVCSGVVLALGHQLLWGVAFGDSPPRLGGNLAWLDPSAQAVLFRSASVVSSLLTGAVVGAVAGAAAWGIALLGRRRPSGQRP